MRVFVSYAGEQRTVADRIANGLRQARHRVFFDRDALPPGDGYDDTIRREIEKSDLFIFLVSPQSIESGGYALTELGFARKRWLNPSGRVIPVMVENTPIDAVDPYLRSVSILIPQGDVVAELLGRVDAIARRRRLRTRAVATAAVVLTLAAGYALWRSSQLLGTDYTVGGTATDRVTGSAVQGAGVEVRQDGSTLQRSLSDANGRFLMTFRARRSASAAELVVEHQDYVPASRSLKLTTAGVLPNSHGVDLLARGLRDCRIKDATGVVVGHFLPPLAGGDLSAGDLADRIARTLTYDLLPRIQALNLPQEVLPHFVACGEAKPRSMDLAAGYARALDADAFLSGNVEPAAAGYDVHALVADRFALFVPPFPAVTRNVQLADPAAARFNVGTHAAILTAIARGYEGRKRYAACVEITVTAEALLGGPNDALNQMRNRCQRAGGLLALVEGP